MILTKDIKVEGGAFRENFVIPKGTTVYFYGKDYLYSNWATDVGTYEGIYIVKAWRGISKEMKAYRRKHVIYLKLKEDEIIDDKFQEAIFRIALRTVDCGELNPQ